VRPVVRACVRSPRASVAVRERRPSPAAQAGRAGEKPTQTPRRYLEGVMNASTAQPRRHRHGQRVHEHSYDGPHRHLLLGLRRSEPLTAGHDHGHGHDRHHRYDGHSHGLVHDSIKRSREGIRAVTLSLAVLALAAIVQAIVFVASNSIALLADLIHNFGDALTAIPLGIAFWLRSAVGERWAGLAVVAAILFSACVAGVEAVQRLIHPQAPSHLAALAAAGAVGYLGNFVAARIRTKAGHRLDSPALIADGNHARADAYVSLAVIASAVVVASGVPVADPIIGLGITLVILRITWQSWRTVRASGTRQH
jgi:Co/Zn/Cd efflux system component